MTVGAGGRGDAGRLAPDGGSPCRRSAGTGWAMMMQKARLGARGCPAARCFSASHGVISTQNMYFTPVMTELCARPAGGAADGVPDEADRADVPLLRMWASVT
ncbi:MAG: hypothetical protein RIQ53_3190 [Pseudomonadota bacterium]